MDLFVLFWMTDFKANDVRYPTQSIAATLYPLVMLNKLVLNTKVYLGLTRPLFWNFHSPETLHSRLSDTANRSTSKPVLERDEVDKGLRSVTPIMRVRVIFPQMLLSWNFPSDCVYLLESVCKRIKSGFVFPLIIIYRQTLVPLRRLSFTYISLFHHQSSSRELCVYVCAQSPVIRVITMKIQTDFKNNLKINAEFGTW